MRTLGWQYPARTRSWTEVKDEYVARGESLEPLVAIVDSVLRSQHAPSIAAFTSMNDLIVVEQPAHDLPYDAVVVRLRGHHHVEIEHMSVSGHNDRIVRGREEAVPLFWRFMAEKFGVVGTDPASGTRHGER